MARVFDSSDEVTIKLTVEKVNLVLAALSKQPLEAVVGVWSDIKTQVETQVNPKPLEAVK